jgi:hypothetical protein
LSIPKQKRNNIVRKYIAGVVVVQVVNHKVTRVLDEKVDGMPVIASIDDVGLVDPADMLSNVGDDTFIFMTIVLWRRFK